MRLGIDDSGRLGSFLFSGSLCGQLDSIHAVMLHVWLRWLKKFRQEEDRLYESEKAQ